MERKLQNANEKESARKGKGNGNSNQSTNRSASAIFSCCAADDSCRTETSPHKSENAVTHAQLKKRFNETRA